MNVTVVEKSNVYFLPGARMKVSVTVTFNPLTGRWEHDVPGKGLCEWDDTPYGQASCRRTLADAYEVAYLDLEIVWSAGWRK